MAAIGQYCLHDLQVRPENGVLRPDPLPFFEQEKPVRSQLRHSIGDGRFGLREVGEEKASVDEVEIPVR